MTRQQWNAEVETARAGFAQDRNKANALFDEEQVRQLLRAMVRGAVQARLLAACAGLFVYCDRIEQRLEVLR